MITSSQLSRVLRYCIYACAFVPLIIFSQYISPFHFGKVVVFRSMIEVMAGLYLLLIWQDRSFLPRRDAFFWSFFAFAAAFSLATVFSVNPYQSFWGTLERMGGVWSFWHYFIFYVMLTSVFRTKDEWYTFLKITVGVGLLSAFYGFGQRTTISFFIGSGGRERIFGTIGNAALFAGYQIINVFLALILAFDEKKKNLRNLYFAGAGIMSLAVFMTVVRGSLLGLVVGFIVLSFLYFLETHARPAKIAFYSMLVAMALFAGFAFLFDTSSFVQNSPFLKRVTNVSLSNATVETRIWAWQAGLKGWSEGPKTMLVGWGPENFNIPFSKYFNPKFFTGAGAETLFDRAHNMFVEVLVTMGLIGLLAYLGIFFAIFKNLWRIQRKPEYRWPAMTLMAMTVAYMIHNSFIFDTSANFIAFFSALGFMSFLNSQTYPAPAAPSVSVAKPRPGLYLTLAAVMFIAIGYLIYQTNVLTAIANYANTRGIVWGANDDFNSAVDYYKQSVSYNVAGRYDYRNKYAQYLLDYTSSNPIDNKVQDVIKDAIVWEQKNADENPLDYLPELYLSRLNIILGKSDPKSPYNDIALQHSEKALSYSPTFVRTYFEIGQAYLNKNDMVKAEATFQKAVDLNPEAGISWWYLAAVEMQEGKVDQALQLVDKAIATGYQLSENDYLTLASTYIKRSDFPHLVSVYQGLVKVSPSNPSYHASLAVAYSKVGRIDDAVAQAHAAVAADPSYEPQAKAFVQSLGRTW